MKLKSVPAYIQPFRGRSDVLTTTTVPVGSYPRAWYLDNPRLAPPPCISSSEFVPQVLVEHLMRNKKNSALGVKFVANRSPPDAITNMEGALHTFVTPIVLAFLHGDYNYSNGHMVMRFAPVDGLQQARLVIVSAQIQPDFEGPDVMLALSALGKEGPLKGSPLPDNFVPPDFFPGVKFKQETGNRKAYDIKLQRHMAAYLTRNQYLPSVPEATAQTLDLKQAVDFLERTILTSSSIQNDIAERCVRLPRGSVLSLELLFNSAVHQLRNELSALEGLCPQGYVYTSDPPAIFAMKIGATILNRLQFAALKHLAHENTLSNMRMFAFNDYADKTAMALLKAALSSQSHIRVVPKLALFTGPRSTYCPLPGSEGALLVIHNNSDAFGQNIETEWESGSMDGAIGANSSAAASLKRDRTDLLSRLM